MKTGDLYEEVGTNRRVLITQLEVYGTGPGWIDLQTGLWHYCEAVDFREGNRFVKVSDLTGVAE